MPTKRHKLDPNKPPRLSAAEKARYDETADTEIDHSDIPALTEEDWARMEIATPTQKPSVTMRVDAQTLDFFKGRNPKGYTRRMAEVLRAYAQSQAPK